jgi:hypothetical protein
MILVRNANDIVKRMRSVVALGSRLKQNQRGGTQNQSSPPPNVDSESATGAAPVLSEPVHVQESTRTPQKTPSAFNVRSRSPGGMRSQVSNCCFRRDGAGGYAKRLGIGQLFAADSFFTKPR